VSTFPYNEKQKEAIERIVLHADHDDEDPFMMLEGPAGTGKTSVLKGVILELPITTRVVCTAPTNKAVRVMREMLGDSTPTCTIYSLLGLKMTAEGEMKQISQMPSDLDLGDFDFIVVDESGMLNKTLMEYIRMLQLDNPRLRWLFMGDRWQLPPVGESISEVWSTEKRAELTEVMRNDNQILRLATHVRTILQEGGSGRLNLVEDHDGNHGVWVPPGGLRKSLVLDPGPFRTGHYKAMAWRNVTVNELNQIIRNELVENPFEAPYQVGERVTVLEPVMNIDGTIAATTDEEGNVIRVGHAVHPLYRNIDCWRMIVETDDGSSFEMFAAMAKEESKMAKMRADLAAEAKSSPSKWRAFWAFKEAFANVRHAYATTTHRSQGSTYDRGYVSWRDIVMNKDRNEMLRCLYVGVSRPRYDLFLG
jgi:exodeoxyribonuclease-5